MFTRPHLQAQVLAGCASSKYDFIYSLVSTLQSNKTFPILHVGSLLLLQVLDCSSEHTVTQPVWQFSFNRIPCKSNADQVTDQR